MINQIYFPIKIGGILFLPINSLQQISYVGDMMEQNFKNNGFNDIPQLINGMKNNMQEFSD